MHLERGFMWPSGHGLWRRTLLCLVLGVASLVTPASAEPGQLDPSFGTGGVVRSDFGGFETATAVAIAEDDSIVAGGLDNFTDFVVARYTANGTPDPTFGSQGSVRTPVGAPLADVAIQPDGRILAVGGAGDVVLIRYNTDGSLDSSFGAGGLVISDLGGHDAGAAIAQQPDGKIVVVGSGGPSFSAVFAVARYNADGTLDPSFGTGGTVFSDIGSGASSGAVDVHLQPDGGIIAAGFVYSGGYLDFAVVRYGSDGVLDPTFGDQGVATVDFGGDDGVGGLAVDGGGRLVLAGGTRSPGTTAADFALVRLRPDGSIDDGFGAGGRVVTDFGGASDTATAVVSQPDGALLVLGQSVVNTADFALARYTADGMLDPGLGSGGKVTTDLSGEWDTPSDMAAQSDGKVVAVGGSAFDFALVRYATSVAPSPITIDVKPGDPENGVNCAAPNAQLAVAVLTTADLNAAAVDHVTVTFEGASERHRHATGGAVRHDEDVDGDGDLDLVLHFRLGDTGLTCNSTEGTLLGRTVDGTTITGTDRLWAVAP